MGPHSTHTHTKVSHFPPKCVSIDTNALSDWTSSHTRCWTAPFRHNHKRQKAAYWRVQQQHPAHTPFGFLRTLPTCVLLLASVVRQWWLNTHTEWGLLDGQTGGPAHTPHRGVDEKEWWWWEWVDVVEWMVWSTAGWVVWLVDGAGVEWVWLCDGVGWLARHWRQSGAATLPVCVGGAEREEGWKQVCVVFGWQTRNGQHWVVVVVLVRMMQVHQLPSSQHNTHHTIKPSHPCPLKLSFQLSLFFFLFNHYWTINIKYKNKICNLHFTTFQINKYKNKKTIG